MQFSPDQLLICTVHDKSGHKVGKVQQVYLDDATGSPSWVTVRTGIFGTNESLVPVEQAELNGNLLEVPFDRQVVHDAPNFDPGHHLDESDEDELYRYYGMSRPPAATPRTTSQGQTRGEPGQQGQVGDERAHEDRIGGEPVQQPPAHSDRASRGEEQQVSPARASGEYVSGSASGERENRDENRRLDSSDSGRPGTGSPDTSTPDTGSPDTSTPNTGSPDTGSPDSERSDSGQERELLQRERDLLARERDLLDRERELAEDEGSIRPRLRRHDPGNRG